MIHATTMGRLHHASVMGLNSLGSGHLANGSSPSSRASASACAGVSFPYPTLSMRSSRGPKPFFIQSPQRHTILLEARGPTTLSPRRTVSSLPRSVAVGIAKVLCRARPLERGLCCRATQRRFDAITQVMAGRRCGAYFTVQHFYAGWAWFAGPIVAAIVASQWGAFAS